LSLLLLAILVGAAAGLVRARPTGQRYQVEDLHALWLVPVAYLPQFLAFQLPATRDQVSPLLAAGALVSSQAMLLVFAWANRGSPGFPALALGLALNLAVIVANGGLMPISPETVARLIPEKSPGAWSVGSRLGTGKDMVLLTQETWLWWLSDIILLPAWFPVRAAYSIGDFLIAAGAAWFFWSAGRRRRGYQAQIERLEYEG
jgi:hypothetical protein